MDSQKTLMYLSLGSLGLAALIGLMVGKFVFGLPVSKTFLFILGFSSVLCLFGRRA